MYTYKGRTAIAAALLTAAVLFATGSDADAQTIEPVITPTITIVDNTNKAKMQSVTDAQVVTSQAALVDALTAQMKRFEESASYVITGDAVDMREAIREAVAADDYVNGTYAGASLSYRTFSDRQELTVNVAYHHTAAQEDLVTSYVQQRVRAITTPLMTDVEKIKAIHDDVVLKTTYAMSANEASVHSPYAITQYGLGVCQAYALLTYRMLTEAGIEARYVTGAANGVGHAWNLVKLDDQWYHLDTTFDDPLFQFGAYDADFVSYDYFLISEQQLLQDHTIDTGYPTASKTNYATPLIGSTSLVTFNGNPMMNLVSYVNETWYYTKRKNGYTLMALSNGRETVLTDQQAFVPTYANGKIYFISTDTFVYTYDTPTGKLEKTAMADATNIRIANGQLEVYVGHQVAYREALQQPVITTPTPAAQPVEEAPTPIVEVPIDEETALLDVTSPVAEDDVTRQDERRLADIDEPQTAIAEVQKRLADVKQNALYQHFKTDAEALIKAYDQLSAQARQALSKNERTRIADVKKKLKKLNAFRQTTAAKGKMKTTSLRQKAWTLTLKTAVKNTAANRKKVVMYDQFGDAVAATVTIKGKKVTVKPKKAYAKGVPYVISASKKMQKTNGKAINKTTNMTFTYKPS